MTSILIGGSSGNNSQGIYVFLDITKLLDTENAHPKKAIANKLFTSVGGRDIFHSY